MPASSSAQAYYSLISGFPFCDGSYHLTFAAEETKRVHADCNRMMATAHLQSYRHDATPSMALMPTIKLPNWRRFSNLSLKVSEILKIQLAVSRPFKRADAIPPSILRSILIGRTNLVTQTHTCSEQSWTRETLSGGAREREQELIPRVSDLQSNLSITVPKYR